MRPCRRLGMSGADACLGAEHRRYRRTGPIQRRSEPGCAEQPGPGARRAGHPPGWWKCWRSGPQRPRPATPTRPGCRSHGANDIRFGTKGLPASAGEPHASDAAGPGGPPRPAPADTARRGRPGATASPGADRGNTGAAAGTAGAARGGTGADASTQGGRKNGARTTAAVSRAASTRRRRSQDSQNGGRSTTARSSAAYADHRGTSAGNGTVGNGAAGASADPVGACHGPGQDHASGGPAPRRSTRRRRSGNDSSVQRQQFGAKRGRRKAARGIGRPNGPVRRTPAA